MNRVFELCVLISSVTVALLLYYYGNVPIDLKAIFNYVKEKSVDSPQEFQAGS